MSTSLSNKAFPIILILTLSVHTLSAQKPRWAEKRTAKRVKAHIEYLASDALEGRSTGSQGEQLSAQYIAEEFESIGLIPKGEKGFFQNLDVSTLRIAQDQSSLMIAGEVITLFMDFYPLSPSANNGKYLGKAININYGIHDPGLNWNDYEHVDVKDKAVLLKIEVPDMDNPHGKFAAWAGLERRIELARSKGAKAVLFYSANSEHYPSGELKRTATHMGLPVLFVKKNLSTLKSPEIDLEISILNLMMQASNVIGYIDHKAKHTVVIGAHHDHLGLGEHGGSLAETNGKIHNGADDNASGVAALLELARKIKKKSKKFKENNYLFIAFTGEELGLLGSKYFIDHPTIPLENINYMINMDMVGKLDSTKKVLMINGVGTSPAWNTAKKEIKISSKKIASIKTTEGGIGASDHSSFYLAGIPSVHFFTGQHGYYHKPSDDPTIINYGGEAFVITYITRWLKAMDQLGRVEYVKTAEESAMKFSFKVTLGIMPDYIYDGEGLRIDGVKPDQTAARSGMQKGDIIISMQNKAVLNIQDYMKILSGLNAGDKVSASIKRGDEIIEMDIQF